jgi:hypothetical protein
VARIKYEGEDGRQEWFRVDKAGNIESDGKGSWRMVTSVPELRKPAPSWCQVDGYTTSIGDDEQIDSWMRNLDSKPLSLDFFLNTIGRKGSSPLVSV